MMSNSKAADILIRMKNLSFEDNETGHMKGDDLLIETIRLNGVNEQIREEIIKAFESLNKWYA